MKAADYKAGQCIGFSLVVTGCLLFAIFGSQFLPEYVDTKEFSRTTCTVQSNANRGDACCDPSGALSADMCSNMYPCYEVTVTYTDRGGTERTATLYKDYVTYLYQDNATCSYYECTANYDTDNQYDKEATRVQDFVSNRGTPGDSYTCYYNPNDKDTVYIDDSYSASFIINLMIWPVVILIAGTVIVVIMCLKDPERNWSDGDEEGDELETDDKVIIMSESDSKYQYDNASMATMERPKTAISISRPATSAEIMAVPGYYYDPVTGSTVALDTEVVDTGSLSQTEETMVTTATSSRPTTAKSNKLLQVPRK